MANVVLDTTVLIDALRERPLALSYLRGLDDRPFCSEVSRVEVLRGVRLTDYAAVEDLFTTIACVALDESLARRAGALGASWASGRTGISTAHLVIAATADLLGAHLATSNVKDFPMFPGLKPPY